jgi:hypothetical protein
MKELFDRKCPTCQKKVTYTIKGNRDKAERNKIICRECEDKSRIIKYKGEGNPFYGKKHTEHTKEKLRDSSTKIQKIIGQLPPIMYGKYNPMYGKSDYYWWNKKYGKEEADKKLLESKNKQSIKSSGENNPMYGKPSPQGSGNGWSGWYNGWYFRSLHELSYMVKVIERFKLKWESGEQKKYLMKYVDWEGKQRNYFCDFVIGGKYLVECKPKKLHGSVSVQSKVKGAKKFCGNNGFKYKLISPRILKDDEIMKLYKDEKIKFLKKYEEKFRDKYSK